MPLILGSQSATAGGDVITNSCRFNDADAARLSRTNGTSSNEKIGTISFWLKLGVLNIGDRFILDGRIDASNRFKVASNTNNILEFWGTNGGSTDIDLSTNRKFQDPAAWMHMVIRVDTTQVSANDRVRLYINGVDERTLGGYSADTIPAQDSTDIVFFEDTADQYIGTYYSGTNPYDGYLAAVIYCDGQSYAPTEFGEFDTDSPTIWKPKTPSGLTFGNNGFHLDFGDSANLGADVSGNGNDFTETNLTASDQATDTPSNNFCTMNFLQNRSLLVYAEGNNEIVGYGDGYSRAGYGTMALSAGKWYYEFKVNSTVPGNTIMGIANVNGINAQSSLRFNPFGSGTGYTYGYKHVDGNKVTSGTASSYGNTYTQNDIMSCAFDLENLKIYFAKNGTWQDSGDPTSGATGTGSAFDLQSGENYMPAQQFDNGPTIQYNFGGCSAFDVASANQDGNGYGNFEYAVPSGYLAICTKNIGSDGG